MSLRREHIANHTQAGADSEGASARRDQALQDESQLAKSLEAYEQQVVGMEAEGSRERARRRLLQSAPKYAQELRSRLPHEGQKDSKGRDALCDTGDAPDQDSIV